MHIPCEVQVAYLAIAGRKERQGGGSQGLVLCQAKLLERAKG